jgi:hypothetical protein
MRLLALGSAEAPQRHRVLVGCHGEQHGIVNNQRNSIWHTLCTYTHAVLGCPADQGSCPISRYCNALLREPPRLLAALKVPTNGRNGSFWAEFRASVHWCKRGGGSGINPGAPGLLVVCNRPVVAHRCSICQRPDSTRPIAAPADHRFLLIPSLIIHDQAGSSSRP